MPSILYYLGITFLLTHEMDAVMYAEWQLLYILRDMNHNSAYSVFLILHVPAFFILLWLGHHQNLRVQRSFRYIAAIFLVVHAVLHTYNAGSPANLFSGSLSHSLIYLAAFFGLAYIVTSIRSNRSEATFIREVPGLRARWFSVMFKK